MPPTHSIGQLVKTTSDISDLTARIDSAMRSLYQTKEIPTSLLEKNFDPNTLDFIRAELGHSLDSESSTKLKEIKDSLKNLPIVKVTLAVKPSSDFIEKLSLFFRKEFEPDTVLDISVDPNIKGGIRIIRGGKVIDLSLAKKIDDYWSSLK